MIISDIAKTVFGEKGLVGGVMDILKGTGVIDDPQREQAAREALMKFELEQGAQEVKLAEIDAQDKDSARKREAAVLQTGDKVSAWVMHIYGLTVLGMTAFLGYNLLTRPVDFPSGVKEVALIFVGVLLRELANILSYYFGTSHSSAQKNDIIARMGK